MNAVNLQRRQISALLFLALAGVVAFFVLPGLARTWIEANSQTRRLEQLVEGQRAIIARSLLSQGELNALQTSTILQAQLLQGSSLNMAVAHAQGTLTGLVETNGGKVLRVGNVAVEGEGSLKPIVTSMQFECDDQDLNDILHAIEFGSISFTIDRAELRSRQRKNRVAAARRRGEAPPASLYIQLKVRGYWQQGSDGDS